MSASAIVDTTTLAELIGVSLLAAVGVTAAFSIAIVGASRFVELRRDGRSVEAAFFGVVTALALAACLGAIVYGIVVIQSK
jgi:cytochrome c biogenesis protein CcdA